MPRISAAMLSPNTSALKRSWVHFPQHHTSALPRDRLLVHVQQSPERSSRLFPHFPSTDSQKLSSEAPKRIENTKSQKNVSVSVPASAFSVSRSVSVFVPASSAFSVSRSVSVSVPVPVPVPVPVSAFPVSRSASVGSAFHVSGSGDVSVSGLDLSGLRQPTALQQPLPPLGHGHRVSTEKLLAAAGFSIEELLAPAATHLPAARHTALQKSTAPVRRITLRVRMAKPTALQQVTRSPSPALATRLSAPATPSPLAVTPSCLGEDDDSEFDCTHDTTGWVEQVDESDWPDSPDPVQEARNRKAQLAQQEWQRFEDLMRELKEDDARFAAQEAQIAADRHPFDLSESSENSLISADDDQLDSAPDHRLDPDQAAMAFLKGDVPFDEALKRMVTPSLELPVIDSLRIPLIPADDDQLDVVPSPPAQLADTRYKRGPDNVVQVPLQPAEVAPTCIPSRPTASPPPTPEEPLQPAEGPLAQYRYVRPDLMVENPLQPAKEPSTIDTSVSTSVPVPASPCVSPPRPEPTPTSSWKKLVLAAAYATAWAVGGLAVHYIGSWIGC